MTRPPHRPRTASRFRQAARLLAPVLGIACSAGAAFGQTAPPPAPAPAPSAETAPPAPVDAGPSRGISQGASRGDATADTTPGPPAIQQGIPGASRRPSPTPSPYKPLFFTNDFSAYVGQTPDIFGENFKLMPIAPGATLTAGGQVRYRGHSEDNRLRPQGATATTYSLFRNRNYLDLKTEYVRGYVESINAYNANSEIPEVVIDENRWDLLNAFVDLNLYDVAGGQGTLRLGRQEILYGDQHLLSPLDWANTRRNFEGYKYIHEADDWRLDLFSLTPVNLAAGSVGGDVQNFDEDDDRKRLWGAWLNRNLSDAASADFYYLYQDIEDAQVRFADGQRHLVGSRVAGKQAIRRNPLCDNGCDSGCDGAQGEVLRTWDYDVQGGYQFGSDNGERVSAGFFNATLGHTWNQATWTPRIAGLFYYGSGDDDANDDQNNTFYTYYPLAHAYWGIIDNLNGQNLLDYSLQASVQPTKKLNVVAAYHLFRKASGDDSLYNVGQVPLGPLGAGTDIGSEIDVIATYQATQNLNFQAGYAHFFYGDFAENNLPQAADDGEFFYFQTTFNY